MSALLNFGTASESCAAFRAVREDFGSSLNDPHTMARYSRASSARRYQPPPHHLQAAVDRTGIFPPAAHLAKSGWTPLCHKIVDILEDGGNRAEYAGAGLGLWRKAKRQAPVCSACFGGTNHVTLSINR